MIKGIFSLRNFVAKQLTKPDAEGIMKLPNKGNIDFGEMSAIPTRPRTQQAH